MSLMTEYNTFVDVDDEYLRFEPLMTQSIIVRDLLPIQTSSTCEYCGAIHNTADCILLATSEEVRNFINDDTCLFYKVEKYKTQLPEIHLTRPEKDTQVKINEEEVKEQSAPSKEEEKHVENGELILMENITVDKGVAIKQSLFSIDSLKIDFVIGPEEEIEIYIIEFESNGNINSDFEQVSIKIWSKSMNWSKGNFSKYSRLSKSLFRVP